MSGASTLAALSEKSRRPRRKLFSQPVVNLCHAAAARSRRTRQHGPMPIDHCFPWRYEPKSRTIQDADSYVIAVLGGNSPERDDRGRLMASVSVLRETLQ